MVASKNLNKLRKYPVYQEVLEVAESTGTSDLVALRDVLKEYFSLKEDLQHQSTSYAITAVAPYLELFSKLGFGGMSVKEISSIMNDEFVEQVRALVAQTKATKKFTEVVDRQASLETKSRKEILERVRVPHKGGYIPGSACDITRPTKDDMDTFGLRGEKVRSKVLSSGPYKGWVLNGIKVSNDKLNREAYVKATSRKERGKDVWEVEFVSSHFTYEEREWDGGYTKFTAKVRHPYPLSTEERDFLYQLWFDSISPLYQGSEDAYEVYIK